MRSSGSTLTLSFGSSLTQTPTTGQGVVVDVDSGRATHLGEFEDVYPVSASEVASVTSAGAIDYHAVPKRRPSAEETDGVTAA